jgi:hypothetical protein
MCGSADGLGVRFGSLDTMRIVATSLMKVLRTGLAIAALIAAPPALYAQGCAMCYQNAAAAGPRTAEALRHGILIMLFPPLFIFAGIIVLAHRRRNDLADSEASLEFQDDYTLFEDPSDHS